MRECWDRCIRKLGEVSSVMRASDDIRARMHMCTDSVILPVRNPTEENFHLSLHPPCLCCYDNADRKLELHGEQCAFWGGVGDRGMRPVSWLYSVEAQCTWCFQ
jgi:hypothetical protein